MCWFWVSERYWIEICILSVCVYIWNHHLQESLWVFLTLDLTFNWLIPYWQPYQSLHFAYYSYYHYYLKLIESFTLFKWSLLRVYYWNLTGVYECTFALCSLLGYNWFCCNFSNTYLCNQLLSLFMWSAGQPYTSDQGRLTGWLVHEYVVRTIHTLVLDNFMTKFY